MLIHEVTGNLGRVLVKQALGQGLVAPWRWSGDINTHSYLFLPDPSDCASRGTDVNA